MLLVKSLFLGILLPAVVCGGLSALVGYLWLRDGEKTYLQWLAAAALSIGYIVGYLGLEGWPPFPSREGIHWFFYLAILGFIAGQFWHIPVWRRLITQSVVSIVIPRLLLSSMFRYTWGQLEGIVWWVCLAVAIFLFWQLVQRSFAALSTGASIPFVYFGISGGSALILALSGSLRLAQHNGVLAALFAASWVIAFILLLRVEQNSDRKLITFPSSASPVVALLLAGIWLNGYFYSEMPAASAILLAVSPLLARVGEIEVVQRLGARKSTLVQIGLIALCVGIAIGIAFTHSGLLGESDY